jgi:hypothetical protein
MGEWDGRRVTAGDRVSGQTDLRFLNLDVSAGVWEPHITHTQIHKPRLAHHPFTARASAERSGG